MKIGIYGLGRMGANMARRWIRGGHEVVVYNRTPEKVSAMEKEGAQGALTLEAWVRALPSPRVLWLMLPAGEVVEKAIGELVTLMAPGDILVEGGNSYYQDDIRRAQRLAEHHMHYLDVGVSGGVWGLENGYCVMAGGDENVYKHVEPLLKTLAAPEGTLYCGPAGAGHLVKMVHNGIEYALMEAYGEGFEILKASTYGGQLPLEKIAHLWNQGSVVRSWLLELLEGILAKDHGLESLAGYVPDSGEGRWTVQQAVDTGVEATGIAHALFKRFRSRQTEAFSDKVVAALRQAFGGHAIATAGQAQRQAGAGAGAVQAALPEEKRL